MSAYIVDPETIDIITRALAVFEVTIYIPIEEPANLWSRYERIDPRQEPEKAAQALLEQNNKSVNYRYKRNEPTPQHSQSVPDSILYRFGFQNPRQLAFALGCVNCYRYQACETEDWMGSPIDIATSKLQGKIARRLCEIAGEKPCWGCSGVDEAIEALKDPGRVYVDAQTLKAIRATAFEQKN